MKSKLILIIFGKIMETSFYILPGPTSWVNECFLSVFFSCGESRCFLQATGNLKLTTHDLTRINMCVNKAANAITVS